MTTLKRILPWVLSYTVLTATWLLLIYGQCYREAAWFSTIMSIPFALHIVNKLNEHGWL